MPADHRPSSEPASRKEAPSIRLGIFGTRPWVPASGSATVREGKAVYYLTKAVDYKIYSEFNQPVEILAKVVCNLRKYYGQDQDATVRLIQKHFNPKSDYKWSAEGIRLTWEMVEPYTPSLGLVDEMAVAKHEAAFLENEVIDLVASTKIGGKVWDHDLLAEFQRKNPEIQVTLHAFTKAVNLVTGMKKTNSNGKRYWVGFHLPTAEELASREENAA